MRHKFYVGIIIIAIIMAPLFGLTNSLTWLTIFFIPIIILYFYDRNQKKHSLLRNFPVLGRIRYIMEFFRPEIQQYFIADDKSEKPFDRETRDIIYQRAKGVRDTIPFGTERDILKNNYEWILHSLQPVSPSEVEHRELIGGPDCKKPYLASRLNISAMSFGAISPNAILALNKGAKIGDFAHNTGEGGLSDYHLAGGGDIIWQVGTGYFGCRDKEGNFDPAEFEKEATRENVKMIELKLSQGAKPAHGGILPTVKITQEIARVRKIKMGQDCVSPPAHSSFSTPKGLLKFIKQLRKLSGGKPVGFKICIGRKSEFLGICKAMLETKITPDFITVDGAEGGTGAAPLEYANHVGTPLNDALIFVHNSLVGINLRDKIKIIASGKVATGFDMLTKIALGANTCNSARAMMLSAGCVQSKQCNANTCPTGVATQNLKLMRGLVVDEKKIRVAQFHDATLNAFKELIGSMGLTDPSELNPRHILRRISPGNVKTYSELYDFLKPGDLLKTKLPENFAIHWKHASADKFCNKS